MFNRVIDEIESLFTPIREGLNGYGIIPLQMPLEVYSYIALRFDLEPEQGKVKRFIEIYNDDYNIFIIIHEDLKQEQIDTTIINGVVSHILLFPESIITNSRIEDKIIPRLMLKVTTVMSSLITDSLEKYLSQSNINGLSIILIHSIPVMFIDWLTRVYQMEKDEIITDAILDAFENSSRVTGDRFAYIDKEVVAEYLSLVRVSGTTNLLDNGYIAGDKMIVQKIIKCNQDKFKSKGESND